jgi:hypothetical protein
MNMTIHLSLSFFNIYLSYRGLRGKAPHATPFTLIRGIKGYLFSAIAIYFSPHCGKNNIKVLKVRP